MKIERSYKKSAYVLAFLIVLLGVFSFGTYVGYNNRPEIDKVFSISNKEKPSEINADFEPFWKVWNVLNEKAIKNKEISNQDRVWGATEGLAASLNDPYTVFLPPEENKLFNEEIAGSFEGIGAEIAMKDNVLTIVAPLKNTPSWNAGLKAGDKVLKIDDTMTNDMTVDEAINLIRGKKGTIVTLTVLRNGENKTREIKVVRDQIEVPALETKLRDDKVFVISFYNFSEKATILFRDALLEFLDSGSDKLIIDLRGNPGGYLDSAIDIASWFIDQGKIIVSENFGEGVKQKDYRSHGPRLFDENLSLVVLVDEGSASASEILAGALKEHGVATLVGEKTFGKGSVQELVPITDDTSLKVTVANWLTPKGTSISLQGLEPDVKVSLTAKDIEAGRDPQMDKAVEILNRNESR
jgi:carboxyl-terminal processing protease